MPFKNTFSAVLLTCLLAGLLLFPGTSFCQSLFQTQSDIENLRLDFTEKLKDLYTLRNIYIDSNNPEATEAAQLFISELRKNIFLANNVLDLAFLYSISKPCDEKGTVNEYVVSRMHEIAKNIGHNRELVQDLIKLLIQRKQETLAADFTKFENQLGELALRTEQMASSLEVSPQDNSSAAP